MKRRTVIVLLVLAVLAIAGLSIASATVEGSWGLLKADVALGN